MTDSSKINTNFLFMDIFGNHVYPLLTLLEKNNPEEFKKNFTSIENGQTFFTRLFESETRFSIFSLSIEDVQFFLNHQFYFNQLITSKYRELNHWGIIEATKKSLYKEDNMIDLSVYCDYLQYFSSFPSYVIVFLTQQLIEKVPGFIESLPEKGFFLLHKAMQDKNVNLVKLLYAHGFRSDTKDNFNKTVYDYVQKDTDLLSLYQSMEQQYFPHGLSESENEAFFLKKLQILKDKAKAVNKNENYSTDAYLEVLKKELPLCTPAQQEEMIATSMLSSDMTVLNKILKIINKTSKSYSPEYFPLWKNLGEATHQQAFHQFFQSEPIPLDSFISHPSDKLPEDASFLFQISKFLSKNQVPSYVATGYGNLKNARSSRERRNHKIQMVIQEHLNIDFLLQSNPQSPKNNWFTTIVNSSFMSNVFISYLKHINEEVPTTLYKEEQQNFTQQYFQRLINSTYFAKNETGEYNIQTLLQKNLFFEYPSLLFTMDKLLAKDYFTLEQKQIYFSALLSKQSYYLEDVKDNSYINLQSLIAHLSEEPGFLWTSLIIPVEVKERLAKNQPTLSVVLRHAILTHSLDEQLPTSQQVKRNKI